MKVVSWASFSRGVTYFVILLVSYLVAPSTHVEAQSLNPFLISPYFGSFAYSQGYSGGHPAYDYLLRYDRVLAATSGPIRDVRWFNNSPVCINNDGNIPPSYCGYGLYILIENTVTQYTTIYAHLSSTKFNLGETTATVGAGEILGSSGSTGWSTGPHLHFEVRNQNDVAIDPYFPNLWKDGQAAGRPIQKPPANSVIVIDDTTDNSNGFRKGRGGFSQYPCPPNSCPYWSHATGTVGTPDYMYSGDMYYTTINRNDYWAQWSPSLPPGGGSYEILIHVPAVHASTWQASYTVVHAWGSNTTRVAQGHLPNTAYPSQSEWVSIGTYRLLPGNYVYTIGATGEVIGDHCGAGSYCELGTDAVKFVQLGSIHLPHVNNGGGGWSTGIYISSNGGLASYLAKYYDANGNYLSSSTAYIPSRGNTVIGPPGNARSVVIDASHDISVVAEVKYNGEPAAYNGIVNADGLGSVGWERAGTSLFVPLVKTNWVGRWSRIYLMNVGSAMTTATVKYYTETGVEISGGSHPIAPKGQVILNPSSYTGAGYYAAKITGGQPLAAIIWEGDNNPPASRPSAYNSFSATNTLLYVPLAKKNYYGHTTGVGLQNTGSSQASVEVTYCYPTGSCEPKLTVIIPPRSVYVLYNPADIPDGFLGSIYINPKSGTVAQPIVGMLSEADGGDRRLTSNLGLAGATTSMLAIWYDSYSVPAGADWRSGLNVTNAASGANTVTAHWFEHSGTLVHTETITLVSSGDSHTFFDNTPNNLRGTVFIQSAGPIVGVSNARDFAGSGDTTMAINVSTR